VCGFFWDADYVAKHLYRDELPFAKIMFNEIRQEYLYKVIDWYIGMNNDWMIDTGKGGRWF
jgi:aminoglycoside 6-adenylyltransferase